VSSTRRGLIYGVVAYSLWGVAPLYWKLLASVGPVELIAHRVVWGMVAFAAIVWLTGTAPAVRAALSDGRTLAVMAVSGTVLAANWGVFIGAVATGHIIEASLGYFITPLVSVALGTLVLGERLRRLQWLAIGLAVTGVVILTWRAGRLPWISVVLATTFGVYGLIRKVARVDSLAGSTIETGLVTPVAIGYLVMLAARGGGQLGHASSGAQVLVLTTGVVTALPLLLFSSAARRLPLSTMGFLQYLGPTIQLVLATAVYGEPFAREQLIAFAVIWLGLAAFSVDLARRSGQAARLSRTGR
jgi:chloramphenicol-sensitive protein RarD